MLFLLQSPIFFVYSDCEIWLFSFILPDLFWHILSCDLLRAEIDLHSWFCLFVEVFASHSASKDSWNRNINTFHSKVSLIWNDSFAFLAKLIQIDVWWDVKFIIILRFRVFNMDWIDGLRFQQFRLKHSWHVIKLIFYFISLII